MKLARNIGKLIRDRYTTGVKIFRQQQRVHVEPSTEVHRVVIFGTLLSLLEERQHLRGANHLLILGTITIFLYITITH